MKNHSDFTIYIKRMDGIFKNALINQSDCKDKVEYVMIVGGCSMCDSI